MNASTLERCLLLLLLHFTSYISILYLSSDGRPSVESFKFGGQILACHSRVHKFLVVVISEGASMYDIQSPGEGGQIYLNFADKKHKSVKSRIYFWRRGAHRTRRGRKLDFGFQ